MANAQNTQGQGGEVGRASSAGDPRSAAPAPEGSRPAPATTAPPSDTPRPSDAQRPSATAGAGSGAPLDAERPQGAVVERAALDGPEFPRPDSSEARAPSDAPDAREAAPSPVDPVDPEVKRLSENGEDREAGLAGPRGSTAAAYGTGHKAQVEAEGLKPAPTASAVPKAAS